LLALGASFLSACTTSSGGTSATPGFRDLYDMASEGGAAPGFHAVSGSGAGDGWFVGEAGTAVAMSGGQFYVVPTGSTATLGGLASLDVGHAYAVEVGGARVLAFDGRQWAPLGEDRAGRAAAATFALAPDDVWVAGDGVEHWDGKTWTQQIPSGTTFTSLSGSFDTDVWAVGPSGAQHYDGHAWTPVTVPGNVKLNAVYVAGLLDAWFVGEQGAVLHAAGNAVATVSAGNGLTANLSSVTGSSQTDIWAGGDGGLLLHWDGAQWSQLTTPSARAIDDVWTTLAGDVLVVDGSGSVTAYTP